jgi:hypothetical protein
LHEPAQQSPSDAHGFPLATHPQDPVLVHLPEQHSGPKKQALPSTPQ